MRCLIHTGPGIGDIIQFLSMARAIKEQFPDAVVDFIMRGSPRISELNQQLLDCQSYADHLYWYAAKEIRHNLKLIAHLQEKQYDFGIVRVGNSGKGRSLWIYRIMRWSHCKMIVGYGTSKVDIQVDVPEHAHYLERNARLLAAIGVKARDNALVIEKNKLDFDWLKSLPMDEKAKVIGLSLGTNPMSWTENGKSIVYDVKSWPLERWAELAAALIEEGYFVVLIGGEKERREIKEQNIAFPANAQILDLVGKTTIKQSLTIIARCDLMVGAEGGMMHCASAVGTKTLTIFGGSDYRMWNPGGTDSPAIYSDLDCYPCFCTSRGAHCKDKKCLYGISTSSIMDRVLEIMVEDCQ